MFIKNKMEINTRKWKGKFLPFENVPTTPAPATLNGGADARGTHHGRKAQRALRLSLSPAAWKFTQPQVSNVTPVFVPETRICTSLPSANSSPPSNADISNHVWTKRHFHRRSETATAAANVATSCPISLPSFPTTATTATTAAPATVRWNCHLSSWRRVPASASSWWSSVPKHFWHEPEHFWHEPEHFWYEPEQSESNAFHGNV